VQERSSIRVLAFIPSRNIVRLSLNETNEELNDRVDRIMAFSIEQKRIIGTGNAVAEDSHLEEKYFSDQEVSQLKELLGEDFLTNSYYLDIQEV